MCKVLCKVRLVYVSGKESPMSAILFNITMLSQQKEFVYFCFRHFFVFKM